MPDFRFSLPTFTQLTPPQRIALMSAEPILITGGPGSGKTVVSVRRLLRLLQSDQKVKLFTFNRTLMAAIRGLAKSESFESSAIESFYDWYYIQAGGMFQRDTEVDISKRFSDYSTANGGKFEEVIIDESQDFEHKIIRSLDRLAGKVSCGADRDQDIRNNYGINAEEQIRDILNKFQVTQEHLLEQNYRNTREIFAFARQFVYNNPRPTVLNLDTLPTGDKPELFDNLNSPAQLDYIKTIVEMNQTDSNIGILVHYKEQVDTIRSYFRANGIIHSYYYSKMSTSDKQKTETDLQTPLIATFASCKGLEFDIVILPFFEEADRAIEKKRTIANHYYVACTRAKRQLFVLFNGNPNILNNFGRQLYKLNGDSELFKF